MSADPTGDLHREIGGLKAASHQQVEYYGRILREQAEQIAALKATLIEERVAGEFSGFIPNQCHHWDIGEEPFCTALDGPCEYRVGKCPIKPKLNKIACDQLQAEGKI